MTLEQLGSAAVDWAGPELLHPVSKLVFLRGPMGAGKTTFVVKIAEILGAPEAASPSYALHSRYEGLRGAIDHFDLDRLASIDELESTGFWDLIHEAKEDPRRFVLIEWAERLKEFGAGAENAPWTMGFRVWSAEFSGPPEWKMTNRLVNRPLP